MTDLFWTPSCHHNTHLQDQATGSAARKKVDMFRLLEKPHHLPGFMPPLLLLFSSDSNIFFSFWTCFSFSPPIVLNEILLSPQDWSTHEGFFFCYRQQISNPHGACCTRIDLERLRHFMMLRPSSTLRVHKSKGIKTDPCSAWVSKAAK